MSLPIWTTYGTGQAVLSDMHHILSIVKQLRKLEYNRKQYPVQVLLKVRYHHWKNSIVIYMNRKMIPILVRALIHTLQVVCASVSIMVTLTVKRKTFPRFHHRHTNTVDLVT